MNFSLIMCCRFQIFLKQYSFVNEVFEYILKVAFASWRCMASPRFCYDGNFLMVTSRFVCGEISRLIKLLGVWRNAQSKETIWRSHQENTCRTHMNASSVFTRRCSSSYLPPPPPVIPSFLHHVQTLAPLLALQLSFRFLPQCFCLINVTHEQKAIKKRRRNGDVARSEREKSLTTQINERRTRDNVRPN